MARSIWRRITGLQTEDHRLISMFFNHCVANDWIRKNPCAGLVKIKPEDPEAEFFTEDEYARIEDSVACYALSQTASVKHRAQQRLRAFIRLLRWSGARITDAAIMKRKSLERNGNRWTLRFRMVKTNVTAVVPIPPAIAEELMAVPNDNAAYFLWTGNGDPETASKDWWERVSDVFAYAGLKNEDGSPKFCKPHMLRDTFAVLALQLGALLEDVQKALGHKSIKTTERYYGHWSRGREDRMHGALEKTWNKAPAAEMMKKAS